MNPCHPFLQERVHESFQPLEAHQPNFHQAVFQSDRPRRFRNGVPQGKAHHQVVASPGGSQGPEGHPDRRMMKSSILTIRRLARHSAEFWESEKRYALTPWRSWETRRRALLARAWASDRAKVAKRLLVLQNPFRISLRQACHEFAPDRFVVRRPPQYSKTRNHNTVVA